jgi:BirA family biotin operon repressor/biotin-[acetyl-CoA-carboxylase] ligase
LVENFQSFCQELLGRPPSWPENLVVLKAVASTQHLALLAGRALAADEERPWPTAFVAFQQSAGRGRVGRSWSSPPGGGIYASCLVDWQDPSTLAELPLRAGVGLAQAASSLLRLPCHLKWPNDLIAGERKLGGVLIESVTLASGSALAAIGFGVNYAPSLQVTQLGGVDILSLNPEAPALADCARILLAGVGTWLDPALTVDRVARAARQITAHRPGAKVSFRAGEEVVEGEFFGLDDSGFLLLRVAGALRRFSAGEIIES